MGDHTHTLPTHAKHLEHAECRGECPTPVKANALRRYTCANGCSDAAGKDPQPSIKHTAYKRGASTRFPASKQRERREWQMPSIRAYSPRILWWRPLRYSAPCQHWGGDLEASLACDRSRGRAIKTVGRGYGLYQSAALVPSHFLPHPLSVFCTLCFMHRPPAFSAGDGMASYW